MSTWGDEQTQRWAQPGATAFLLRQPHGQPAEVTVVKIARVGKRDIVVDAPGPVEQRFHLGHPQSSRTSPFVSYLPVSRERGGFLSSQVRLRLHSQFDPDAVLPRYEQRVRAAYAELEEATQALKTGKLTEAPYVDALTEPLMRMRKALRAWEQETRATIGYRQWNDIRLNEETYGPGTAGDPPVLDLELTVTKRNAL